MKKRMQSLENHDGSLLDEQEINNMDSYSPLCWIRELGIPLAANTLICWRTVGISSIGHRMRSMLKGGLAR